MLRDIIQMSYLILVADVTLLLFILFNSTFAPERRGGFLLSTSISLLMVLCNIFVCMCEGSGEHLGALKFFMAMSYAISGPVVLPFIRMSAVIVKRVRFTLYGFAIVNALLSFSSIWTGWIFYYEPDGTMKLGPLSPIPFFLCAMYIAVMLAASFLKFRRGMRGESAFLALLSAAIVMAAVLNTVYGFQFLISGMAVLSCIFYYMYFASQTLTRDALTNALNRHSFYKDITALKKRQMIVISLDLNGLKQINDTQGHDAGDRAILAVADCVHELLPSRCRFYRMGGDEFEILCPGMRLSDAKALFGKLGAAVQQRGYSTAIGYCAYTKEQDMDAVIRAADEMMYENKRQMKAEKAEV